ncbi:MAG: prepilin-type N-terminal cleavage/methylation domain-containing protein [Actinobacteria bacterium]|nr:prepilin-type N-terminal cleavage/methylation domain-containing protein [Actinomycetota bacterium]
MGKSLRGTSRLRRDERGFTLVELMVAVVIIGVITAPLADVVIGYLHNADATTARLSESHDAQISAAYFAADVTSLGVRSTTYSSDPSAPYPLTQSVEENAPATGGLFPCGTAATPNAVIRFGWDDYAGGAGAAPTRIRVAYVVQSDSSGQQQLHRLACAGSATVTSDVVVVHNLVSATASCASASAPTACSGSGSATPLVVDLTLAVHDPQSTGAPNYQFVLTGQRRQS